MDGEEETRACLIATTLSGLMVSPVLPADSDMLGREVGGAQRRNHWGLPNLAVRRAVNPALVGN